MDGHYIAFQICVVAEENTIVGTVYHARRTAQSESKSSHQCYIINEMKKNKELAKMVKM